MFPARISVLDVPALIIVPVWDRNSYFGFLTAIFKHLRLSLLCGICQKRTLIIVVLLCVKGSTNLLLRAVVCYLKSKIESIDDFQVMLLDISRRFIVVPETQPRRQSKLLGQSKSDAALKKNPKIGEGCRKKLIVTCRSGGEPFVNSPGPSDVIGRTDGICFDFFFR